MKITIRADGHSKQVATYVRHVAKLIREGYLEPYQPNGVNSWWLNGEPEPRPMNPAAREAAHGEAIRDLKRAFPTLTEDYTDSFFGRVVDIVVATYREWDDR